MQTLDLHLASEDGLWKCVMSFGRDAQRQSSHPTSTSTCVETSLAHKPSPCETPAHGRGKYSIVDAVHEFEGNSDTEGWPPHVSPCRLIRRKMTSPLRMQQLLNAILCYRAEDQRRVRRICCAQGKNLQKCHNANFGHGSDSHIARPLQRPVTRLLCH